MALLDNAKLILIKKIFATMSFVEQKKVFQNKSYIAVLIKILLEFDRFFNL